MGGGARGAAGDRRRHGRNFASKKELLESGLREELASKELKEFVKNPRQFGQPPLRCGCWQ
jgi:hypothetical protein